MTEQSAPYPFSVPNPHPPSPSGQDTDDSEGTPIAFNKAPDREMALVSVEDQKVAAEGQELHYNTRDER